MEMTTTAMFMFRLKMEFQLCFKYFIIGEQTGYKDDNGISGKRKSVYCIVFATTHKLWKHLKLVFKQ
jgi:hypothetical protein